MVDSAMETYLLYAESVAQTLRLKYPGILVNNEVPGDILVCFVAQQQNEKTITVTAESSDLPKLKLDARPFTVDRADMNYEIEIANPYSKELIIEHFEMNLRKWVAAQRVLFNKLDKVLSSWEVELNK